MTLKGFIVNTCIKIQLLVFCVLNQLCILPFKDYLQEYSRYLRLITSWRTGQWKEDIIDQALELAELNASKRNIKFAINFIRDARGENKRLNDLLDVQQHVVSPSVLALMGSYYLVNGHERRALRCCQICCKAKPDAVKKYLALSVFASKKGVRISSTVRATLKSRESILYKAEKFSKINDEIFKNKTIAVVGNAAVEVGLGMGKIIDMHDLVVRFNNFSLEGQFTQDYGSKTHIWVRSPSIREVKYTPFEGLKCILVSGYPVLHRPTMMWNWLDQLVGEKTRFAFFPMKIYHELCKRLSAPPSAGIQFIYSLYKLRVNMQRVSLYGFDFNQNIAYQYFSKAKASERHNWALEYELYKEIAEVVGEVITGFASKAG